MAKIVLDIDDRNLDTVMTILKSLKTGLIQNIETQKSSKRIQPVSSSLNKSQQPKREQKQNRQPILEDEFMSKTSSSKYMSPKSYKNKLHSNEQNSNTTSKTPSSARYISPEEFKNRLKK